MTATVSDWFPFFFAHHKARHPRPDWPTGDAGERFSARWRFQFEVHRVQQKEAEVASVALKEVRPLTVHAHLDALLKLVIGGRGHPRKPVAVAARAEQLSEPELKRRWEAASPETRARLMERAYREVPSFKSLREVKGGEVLVECWAREELQKERLEREKLGVLPIFERVEAERRGRRR